MAIKTIVTDDTNGDFGAKPHTFALDGVTYSLDLTDESYDRLVQSVADFVNAAQRTPSALVPAPSPSKARARSLDKMNPAHRARNAQIIVRVDVIERRGHTTWGAYTVVGEENGLSPWRISQLAKDITLAEAKAYLATHP